MKKMLTKEECNLAIECLKISALESTYSNNRKYVLNNYEEIKQLINEHFELVEKTTPKRAILMHEYDGYVYECPNCHEEFRPNYILDNITWKGCPFCLQALDWSEEDEVE